MLNVVNQDMGVIFSDPLGPDSDWIELIRTLISCIGTACVHPVVLFITVQQTIKGGKFSIPRKERLFKPLFTCCCNNAQFKLFYKTGVFLFLLHWSGFRVQNRTLTSSHSFRSLAWQWADFKYCNAAGWTLRIVFFYSIKQLFLWNLQCFEYCFTHNLPATKRASALNASDWAVKSVARYYLLPPCVTWTSAEWQIELGLLHCPRARMAL